MGTVWRRGSVGAWRRFFGGASVLLVAACGGNGDTDGGAGAAAVSGTGGGAGAAGATGTGGSAGAEAATGGSGGLAPVAACTPAEGQFALCGPNFNPDGDCVCTLANEWACPQVGCNPCPAERVNAGCDPGADSGGVLYAKEPGDAAHCCTYTNSCAAPEGWSVYATPRECMRASN